LAPKQQSHLRNHSILDSSQIANGSKSEGTITPNNKKMKIVYLCPICSITTTARKNIRAHLKDVEKIELNKGRRGEKGKFNETVVSDLFFAQMKGTYRLTSN
jgi:hypothetical protein